MCNAERVRQGFIANGLYPMCKICREDINHVFKECPVATHIWKSLLQPDQVQQCEGLTFMAWLEANLKGNVQCRFVEKWSVVFAITLWWINLALEECVYFL